MEFDLQFVAEMGKAKTITAQAAAWAGLATRLSVTPTPTPAPTPAPVVIPGATNTGLAGVGLTDSNLTAYTGPNSIPSGTYDKKIFLGNYSIASGANVVITRSKLIQPSGGWAVIRIAPGTTGNSLTISDSDYDGRLAGEGAYGLAGARITATRMNGWGSDNIGIFDRDSILSDSYIHDLGFVGAADGTGSHPDGWEHNGGGSNITFRNVVFDARMPAGKWATSALMINAENGPVSNITIDKCRFIVTSGFALYLDPKTNSISGVTLTDNVFDVSGNAYGSLYMKSGVSFTKQSGNVSAAGVALSF